VASVGVKVTEAAYVPALAGTVEGVVKAKLPPMLAVPAVRVDAERACPYIIAEDVGQSDTVGVTLLMVSVAVFEPS
jgi:hypothetical protein